MGSIMKYETIIVEVADHIATVTLNRPDKLNAFNQQMCDEFEHLWSAIRLDDDVRVVVLQANGERAFCTGVDVREGIDFASNIWSQRDPGAQLGPKYNKVWKPLVTALHGMVAGGALYWVNEADIVICSDDATFFDPHVSYGITAALEPSGLARRVPLGEALRMALLGLDERMSATRAREIGLVSEIVPADAPARPRGRTRRHDRRQAPSRDPGHRQGRLAIPRHDQECRAGSRHVLHPNRQPHRRGPSRPRDPLPPPVAAPLTPAAERPGG
jgi:enoyl-CoA hydratase/carnithine racemase